MGVILHAGHDAEQAQARSALEEHIDALTVQRHVLQGSLLVSREQLASAAMIKNSMQDAAQSLTQTQLQHLLLHLSSNMLAERGQAAGLSLIHI